MRREDVEALRARMLRDANNVAGHGVKLADMTFSVEGDTLDALCRRWLAVEDAQIREVEEEMHGLVIRAYPLQKGQRVRIVPVDGGKGEP